MNTADCREALNRNLAKLAKAEFTKMFDARLIVRFWANVRQEDIDALTEYLLQYTDSSNGAPVATVVDPFAHISKKLSGTYRQVRTWWDWADPEPAGSTPASKRTLNIYQALYKDDGAAVAFVVTDGDCRYTVETEWTMRGTTFPALPAKPWPAGTTYKMGPVAFNEQTNTYSSYIEKRTVIYRNVTGITVSDDPFVTVTEQQQLGVTTQDPATVTQVPGTRATQDTLVRDDCSKDIKTRTETAKEVAAEASSVVIDAFKKDSVVEGRNVVVEPTLPVAQTPGLITRLRKQLNLLFRWNVVTDTSQSIEQAASGGVGKIDAYKSEEQAEGRNLATEPTLPVTQTPGIIITVAKKLNAWLRWDRVTTTETATERAAAASAVDIDAFKSDATTEGQHLVTEPTLPVAQTPGIITRMRKRLNLFLRWDKEETNSTATEQAASGGVGKIDAYKSEEQTEGRNLVTEPTLPGTQTPGIIITVAKKLNAWLRWDRVTTTETAIQRAAAANTVEIDAFKKDSVVEGQNLAAEPSLPSTQIPGIITRLRKKFNLFMRWDKEETTSTATEQSASGATGKIDAFKSEEQTEGRNLAAEPTLPTTQTPGTVVTLAKKLNAWLRWDRVTTTEIATERAAAANTVEIDAFKKDSVVEGQNLAAEPSLPSAQIPGIITRMRKRLNLFLRWDKEETNSTATEQSASGATGKIDAFKSEEQTEGRNLEAEPTLPTTQTPGRVVTLAKKLNAWLRWDRVTTTEIATEQAASASTKRMDAQETETTVEGTNLASEPTLPTTRSDGFIVTMRKRLNLFLRWDKSETTQQAIAWHTGVSKANPWLAYADDVGTSQWCAFGNFTAGEVNTVLATFVPGMGNSFNAVPNRYGLFDGSGTMTARKGSVPDFDSGIDFTTPEMSRGSNFKTHKASVLYTTSPTNAQAHLNAALSPAFGTIVDQGAGESSGIRYVARGTWRVVRVEGV